MAAARPRYRLLYTDTGGTFTDTFLVDEQGRFVIAKAPSTPDDIARGYFDSVGAAAEKIGLTREDLFRELEVLGYGATVVLNTVLTRSGARVGVITTRGFEQIFDMGRGKQSWTGFTVVDRIHARTHHDPEPLVPIERIRGVTERTDARGRPIVPLYEHEVSPAARELIADLGCEAVVVGFLFSWRNPAHELRAKEIVMETARELGRSVDVYTSYEITATRRELPRFNSAVVEAYTGRKVKEAFRSIQRQIRAYGFRGNLQIMQSSGGLASVENVKAVETIQSGPVGGLIGGKFVGDLYGLRNVLTTDVGGTSFDVGIITDGRIEVNREPEAARFLLGVPIAAVNSIGAGGGTLARLDPVTKRIVVGPESAGARPGPVAYGLGGTCITTTDCDVLLGYIDPDYFLGGRIRLDREGARACMEETVSGPLGLTVEAAALGIVEILDVKMRDAAVGMIMAKGFDVGNYTCMAFGGAGPTHVAGYTRGVDFRGVMVFPYSAVFSAFGASCADYEHHYSHALTGIVPASASAAAKLAVGAEINAAWETLEKRALEEMALEGYGPGQVRFIHLVMVRYGRQLEDLIVPSPVSRVLSLEDWDRVVDAFERMYEKVYTSAGKYPAAGYEILEVGLVARVDKIKPVLRRHPLEGAVPQREAFKGVRACYFRQGWVEASVWDYGGLRPGNWIAGPALVENETTVVVVPPDRDLYVDEYLTGWLRAKGEASLP